MANHQYTNHVKFYETAKANMARALKNNPDNSAFGDREYLEDFRDWCEYIIDELSAENPDTFVASEFTAKHGKYQPSL